MNRHSIHPDKSSSLFFIRTKEMLELLDVFFSFPFVIVFFLPFASSWIGNESDMWEGIDLTWKAINHNRSKLTQSSQVCLFKWVEEISDELKRINKRKFFFDLFIFVILRRYRKNKRSISIVKEIIETYVEQVVIVFIRILFSIVIDIKRKLDSTRSILRI